MTNFLKLISGIAIFFISATGIINCTGKTHHGEQALKDYFFAKQDSLILSLSLLDDGVNSKQDIPDLKLQFLNCRKLFKQTEAMTEYYFQGLTRRINGPALPDIKLDDSQVWPPHGFQVIEQLLYENYDSTKTSELRNEIQLLQTDLRFVSSSMRQMSILPLHVYELLQHEMIRIATMGVSGADAPLSQSSLPEAGAALEGIRSVFQQYYGADKWSDSLHSQYYNSINYLAEHNDFNTFDRLEFITVNLMPLSVALADKQYSNLRADSLNKPFFATLSGLMQGKGFNADAYSGYAEARSNPAKIELGKKLFYDPQLSNINKISCSSCHEPEKYFADGEAKAGNFVHGGTLQRNSPTLYYAAFQGSQFYDMRSTTLEDQAHEVMRSQDEFSFASNDVAKKLWADAQYKALFQRSFDVKDSITGFEVRNAIAAYVRTLAPFSSPFDEYMRGNRSAMNNQAREGFNLFMGKAKCGTCHFAPLFNGTIPPWFTKSESEVLGVPSSVSLANATIDRDSGRYKINSIAELLYAFKTPTVRNAEKTGPFMHNGVYNNLEDLMTFYQKGGGAGIGIELPNQSLPFDSLVLNDQEKQSIIAFIKTLTDKNPVKN